MRRSGHRCAFPALVLAAAVLLCAGPARALTDEALFRQFGFDFINPGARALGLGGAFVSISDDATAAQANPAGLYQVLGPEFFGEYRVIDRDPRITTGSTGSLAVDGLTGARELPYLGATAVSDIDQVSEPTFVSFAYPLVLGSAKRRLTLSLSRQILLSEERSLASGDDVTEARFAFDTFPNTVSGGMVEAYSVATQVTGQSSTEIVYWNLGAAFEVHPDFSLGLTVTQATLDVRMATVTQVVDPLELFLDPSHPRLPGQAASDIYRTGIDDDDQDFAYTVGIHWHPDTSFSGGRSPWRFGAVFRKGADFAVEESTVLNDVPGESFENRFVVPDRYAAGLAYSTAEHWLFAAEYEWIEYSDLLKGFRSGVSFLTGGQLGDDAFPVDPDATIEYKVDDGGVPRLGAEYRFAPFARGMRLAVRAGYYRSPDDRIRMTAFNSSDPDVNDAFLRAFGAGEELDHVTAGVGFRFGRSRIHVAGDFADAVTQVVGSYTYTMGEPAD